MDFARLRQDALYVLENYEGTPAATVANAFLRIHDDPSLVVPAGYSLVRKPILSERMKKIWRDREEYRSRQDAPELLGKGVPQR